MADMVIQPWSVTFDGTTNTWFARSRGKALSFCWEAYRSYRDISFKEFLRTARAVKSLPHDRFGEKIRVQGRPAFLVSLNNQYIQFVRPGSDVILNSHPLDVVPPEARRGTSYSSQLQPAVKAPPN